MIKRVILSNFRNFSIFKSNFERVNVIKGRNGAGKTNLLEAIYFSLNGHPFNRNLKGIIKHGEKQAGISSQIGENTVHITVFEDRKVLKLNGKTVRVIDLKKKFPCVDYSINSFISFKSKDYLFSLIDRGVFAEKEVIMSWLLEYKRLMATKRKLLKKDSIDRVALNVLNEKLIRVISDISNIRRRLIDAINERVADCFNGFTGKSLKVEYVIGSVNGKFEEEIVKKRVLVSLKKDNLKIFMDNLDMFMFSSVGEKKVALLCIVLAIVKLYNENGRLPVFIVDDLEGDLDSGTQKKAFKTIINLPNQIFITTLGAYSGYNTIELNGGSLD